MSTYAVVDRNNSPVNFGTNPIGVSGNVAGNAVITDPSSGNQANIAPNNVALLVSSDGTSPTFRWSVSAVTPVATPTDVLIIQGSGSHTVRIKRIKVTGFATTAGQLIIQAIRRSTAGTLGSATLVAISPGKHDINDVAATAAISYVQTANYGTLGTTAGQLGVGRAFLNVAATGPTTEVVFDFCTRQDKAIILRGTSDFVCLNCAGATLPTGAELDFEIEAEEI